MTTRNYITRKKYTITSLSLSTGPLRHLGNTAVRIPTLSISVPHEDEWSVSGRFIPFLHIRQVTALAHCLSDIVLKTKPRLCLERIPKHFSQCPVTLLTNQLATYRLSSNNPRTMMRVDRIHVKVTYTSDEMKRMEDVPLETKLYVCRITRTHERIP